MSNADLVALRVRVIALENLLISLLATASDEQLELAHEMAGYISPRPYLRHSAVGDNEFDIRFILKSFHASFAEVAENTAPCHRIDNPSPYFSKPLIIKYKF